MNLSDHFTLAEFTESYVATACGIENMPPPDILGELTKTANLLEQIRAALGGHPIHITSGYRCEALNKEVRGVSTSQHCAGQAVDFTMPSAGPPDEVCRLIVMADPPIQFDQLIYERGGWVHISQSATPRRQVLTIDTQGRTTRGITT